MAIALKENRPVRGAEAIAERPDGTRVPFIPFPTPIRDSAGNLVGAVNMLVDVSERRQAEANQKVLFDELNHRVKNNMQMLSGLIRAGLRETTSAEALAVLTDASRRVGAMGAAQRVLYETATERGFNALRFLETVCESVRQAIGPKINLKIVEAPGDNLANDSAMPLALILNELITNAAKHGINERGEGEIRVGLARQGEGFLLYVEDDGEGFEVSTFQKRASGLGLVSGLARQLGGRFEVYHDPMTRCVVEFNRHALH
jgi:two-component sensor histidine kinase